LLPCFSQRLLASLTAVLALLAVLPSYGRAAQSATAQSKPERENGLRNEALYGTPDTAAKERKQIRVGLYQNKPKIYTDETGIPSGIFVEILGDIARKERWQITYVPCQWAEGLEALSNGTIDLMPDVAYSPERAQHFAFHDEEVIPAWSALYSSSRKPVGKISDLNGLRIALLKDSVQRPFLQQWADGFGYHVTFVETRSYDEAFRLTAKDVADVVVANNLFGDYFHTQYGLKKTPVVFQPVSLFFAAHRGVNSDLLAAIDRNLKALKSEPHSAYYRAIVRWMEAPTRVMVPPYLVWVLRGIVVFLVFTLLMILLLRWQVRIRTRDLVNANILLTDSEKKFRDLFYQHTAVKLLIDPDTGSIVEANAAAERFYGWSCAQLQQMRIQDINTLSPEQVKAEIEKARTAQRIHFEFRHRLANGSVRDVAVFTSTIVVAGRTLLHSIVHDITERRRLEEQLRQAQKMEAVGRLAGGVAHDFNNYLMGIMGYAQLGRDVVGSEQPVREYLDEITRGAERSANLTRQLLAFARKQVITPRVLAINEAVESILKMLRRLIGEDVDLVWVPGPDIWPVKIDAGQVDQVLANLCVNARDAIPGTGKVTIQTANVTVTGEGPTRYGEVAPGEYAELVVSDTGCGMDTDTLGHLFEPFFTTKPVGGGTGLGLATVHGIVKQNGGFINASSEPGRGTVFRIYLPRCRDAIDAPTAPVSLRQLTGAETVLLVEDARPVRATVSLFLQSLGYKVLAAETPDEALRLAAVNSGSIRLLIADIVMPGMYGPDLAKKLAAKMPALKCLFISGYTPDVIANRGILDRDIVVVSKPFTRDELARRVREVLDGK